MNLFKAERNESIPSRVVVSHLKERDALKRKIEQRPSKQKLVTQHILLSGLLLL